MYVLSTVLTTDFLNILCDALKIKATTDDGKENVVYSIITSLAGKEGKLIDLLLKLLENYNIHYSKIEQPALDTNIKVDYNAYSPEGKELTNGDVANAISDKLVFRHPHVFGDVTAENAEQVLHNWEELKQRERKMQQLKNRSVMSGVPRSLPPLVKAFRIQEKASAVGFDWAAADDVWEKVKEEICEFETEVKNNDKDKMQAEFGDLLFAMVNAARLYGLSPEAALEATNRKFLERFDHIEQTAQQEGVEVKDLGIDRMEELWQQAKKIKH
jgi:XTP/dITP diphosphohydrolase